MKLRQHHYIQHVYKSNLQQAAALRKAGAASYLSVPPIFVHQKREPSSDAGCPLVDLLLQ
jgi:hypothetical protein